MRTVLALVLAMGAPAFAQEMEPGEWEFQVVITAPGMPKPQPMANRQCLTAEQAKDPLRWGGNPGQPADCRITTLKKGPDAVSWQMECPATGMKGTGSARFGRGSMQSETQVGGGNSVDLRTRTTARRLGPCKP
jgi:Protein of unknown function (DUF3617)